MAADASIASGVGGERPALFFENGRCGLCFRHCRLAEGETGACRARTVRGGRGIAQSYGKVTSTALDRIEKKPLAFYKPRTTVYSIGSFGCNMACPFCQNASIAQAGERDVGWRRVTPEQVVDEAVARKAQGCIGVAYTYNEPATFYEFFCDCAKLARAAGLDNVVVSNGMIEREPLEAAAPLVDAANIDVKCFTDDGYRALGGDLASAKRTVETLVSAGAHVEVTTLVVPGLSDDEAQIDALAAWLSGIDPTIPYHLTRFFPRYRMRLAAATPLATLERLRTVAGRHLERVVLGNV